MSKGNVDIDIDIGDMEWVEFVSTYVLPCLENCTIQHVTGTTTEDTEPARIEATNVLLSLANAVTKLQEENDKLKKEVLRVIDERDDPGYMK